MDDDRPEVFDTDWIEDMICPHCGQKQCSDDILLEAGDRQCVTCKHDFHWELWEVEMVLCPRCSAEQWDDAKMECNWWKCEECGYCFDFPSLGTMLYKTTKLLTGPHDFGS